MNINDILDLQDEILGNNISRGNIDEIASTGQETNELDEYNLDADEDIKDVEIAEVDYE